MEINGMELVCFVFTLPEKKKGKRGWKKKKNQWRFGCKRLFIVQYSADQ